MSVHPSTPQTPDYWTILFAAGAAVGYYDQDTLDAGRRVGADLDDQDPDTLADARDLLNDSRLFQGPSPYLTADEQARAERIVAAVVLDRPLTDAMEQDLDRAAEKVVAAPA